MLLLCAGQNILHCTTYCVKMRKFSVYVYLLTLYGTCFTENLDPTVCKESLEQCKPGYFCSENCKVLNYCVELSNGNFSICVLDNCRRYGKGREYHCSSSSHSCMTGLVQCPAPFKCNDEGLFPDPYDETQYYHCDSEHNAVLKACNDTDEIDICRSSSRKAVLPCTRIGECNKIPNTDIFYLCVRDRFNENFLHPEYFRCIRKYFDQYKCQCTDERPPSYILH